MADSTAPVLLTGGITFLNKWIGNDQGIDLKILVGTGIAAGLLALLEKVNHGLAVGLAWIAFITSALIPPATGNSAVNNLLAMTGQGKG